MARSRGGAMGLVVALVIVSLFFVTALVFVILLFSEREKFELDKQHAEHRLKFYVNETDRDQTWLTSLIPNDDPNSNPPKVSGMSSLHKETLWYKNLISGPKGQTRTGIQEELKRNGIPKDVPLISTILDYKNQAGMAVKQAEEKESIIKRQTNDVSSLTAQLQAEAQKFQESIEAEKARIAELQKDKSEIQSRYDALIKKQKDGVAQVQDTNRREVGKLRGTIAQLKQEITALKRALAEKLEYVENIKLKGMEKQPDGIIESTSPNDNLVYINLTRKDRVILGMTFEVYDKATGIIEDQFGNLKGKGTIEVVTVTDTQTVCRVVKQTPARPIRPGDVIGNVVFSRNMTFKFYVWGYFDIDNIGNARKDDMKRIGNIIDGWGGKAVIPKINLVDDKTELKRQELKNILQGAITKLDDGTLDDSIDLLKARVATFQKSLTQGINKDLPWRFLTPDLDFVVIGAEPEVPAEPDELTADPRLRKRWETLNRDYQIHKAIEAEARDLGIATLNQNRFLQLVGYYKRSLAN